MNSSVRSTHESHATASGSGVGLVRQPTLLAGSQTKLLYRKGDDTNLDKGFSRYQRMRLWSAGAVDDALTEEEANTLTKLWKKERITPRKLTVEDVKKLVDFSCQIESYRRRVKREQSRRRKERARAELRKAAKNGDAEAKRKIKKLKISSKKRFAKYYKRKLARKLIS